MPIITPNKKIPISPSILFILHLLFFVNTKTMKSIYNNLCRPLNCIFVVHKVSTCHSINTIDDVHLSWTEIRNFELRLSGEIAY